jgi:hypothetical protein
VDSGGITGIRTESVGHQKVQREERRRAAEVKDLDRTNGLDQLDGLKYWDGRTRSPGPHRYPDTQCGRSFYFEISMWCIDIYLVGQLK